MTDDASDLLNFKGIARLFPLPNVVLFPWVMQGLHIFEPRYRQMTADALADDRLIALVLLQPGWEADYEGCPAVHPVGCLGRIVWDQRLDDGRYNLQLRGIGRVHIEQEVPNGKNYRSARVKVLADMPLHDAKLNTELRLTLRKVAKAWCPSQEPAAGVFAKLLQSTLPLGMTCDVLSHVLPLPVAAKQELLEKLDVEERVRRLLHFLETTNPPKPTDEVAAKFPPDFSAN
jgi:Lon protease-like protein